MTVATRVASMGRALPRPNACFETGALQAALANTLRRFAAPATPHVKR